MDEPADVAPSRRSGGSTLDRVRAARLYALFSVRQFASASALVALAIAAFVLLSWVAGRWGLLTFGAEYVPTAPVTALLLIPLSVAVLLRALRPQDARAGRWGMALAALCLAGGGLVAANAILGVGPSLEDLLGIPLRRHQGLLVGRMSPVTALAFLALSVALLLRARRFGDRTAPRIVAGFLATLVLSATGTILLAYAAGAPLLYGTDIVPMAVPTAVAFLLLGGATLTLSFRAYLPNESASEAAARVQATVAYLLILLVVSVAVVLLLRGQLADVRHSIAATLNTIADQKVLQVSEWRRERLSDGSFVARVPYAAVDVRELLTNPQSRRAQLAISRWPALLGNGRVYDRVALFDLRDGAREVYPIPGQAPSRALRRALEGFTGGSPMLSTLYRRPDGGVAMALLIPFGAARSGTEASVSAAARAVLVLEVDAERDFYPMVASWPTPSRTAEIQLVEREDDEVRFLSALRYWPDSALLLRRPMTARDIPAVRAARGEVGIADGVDYRGVAVLAATRVIPGAPWRLVAKVDHVEIYAPLRQRALLAGIALAAFAVAAALGLSSLWRARALAVRREADARERAAEARFRDVFETANVGKSITTPEGLVSVNQAYADMLGYDREELEAMSWQALTPPEDIAAIEAILAPLLAGVRTSARFRKRYLRKDGGIVWTDVSTVLKRDANGRPQYFITTVVDISDRVKAEEALRKSEERFAAAFHVGPAGLVITRIADGMVLEANDAFCRLFEVTRDEVIGRTSLELGMFTPESRRALIERQLVVGGVRDFDLRSTTRTGRVLDLIVSSQPIEIDGAPHHITTVIDVTDRKRAETLLRESEARFATAFQSSPVGIFLATLDGTYIDVNQAFCDLVGCTRDQLIGRRVGVLGNASAELRERVIAAADRAGGTLRDVEHAIRHLDGSERHIIFSTTVIELHGQPLRLSTCQDITERRRAEAQIRELNTELERRIEERTAQLLASNQELEAFAYSVSHDLRAPLRAVDGYISILQQQYGTRLDDEGRRLCGVIGASARNLGRLIDELLAYSRTGRAEVWRTPLDMTAMVRAVYEEITTPNLRARVTFTVGSLPPATADATLMRQVWTNLLDNAVKFSARRERAVIEVGWRGEVAPAGAYFVRDNGAGFDMRFADKLFGIFQRLHATREFAGTGVGLALVDRIVKRHGGRVWAEAAVNEGATFYFTVGA